VIRAAVIDDNAEVRSVLAAALRHGGLGDGDLDIAQYPCRVLHQMSEPLARLPDVAVVRLAADDPECGLRACRWLREHHPQIRAVAVIGRRSEGGMVAAFAAGARGVVAAGGDGASLPTAVRTVADGGMYVDPQMAEGLVHLALRGQRETGPFGLSMQELRVLERLPRGLTNREIGVELAISEHTVKSHVRSILRKLAASDRAEAAAIALRHGLT